MNRPFWISVLLPLLLVILDRHDVLAAEPAPSNAERLFALEVLPLLRDKCLGCHGEDPDNIESGFDIRSREALLRGGDAFGSDVLIPGNAEESFLVAMVRRTEEDFEMPPKESEQLSDQQIGWIRDWINGGAPWPNEARVAEIYDRYAAGLQVKTSGGLSEEWTNRKYQPEDLWAYQPLWRDTDGLLLDWSRNPIDWFVDERLRSEELSAAPAADRRTLVRRATFDLLGLPPDPERVDAFVADPRDDDVAFRELVDELLDSPHYGEQWGRYWLDVVRYADSSGYANDWERPNAWRYRDYVIRAFNADKPYDEFIQEQIAGDELYERLEPDQARSSELLIAAGFLRMGPWEHTGMSVAKVTRQLFLDDITDSVGQVFLGHALQCCRCHDHKFDPLPTRDYYSVQAVFATTQFAEVDAPWLPSENLAGMEEDKEYHQKREAANADMLARLDTIRKENHRKWFEERDLPYRTRKEAMNAGVSQEDLPPNNSLTEPDEFGQERIGRKWQTRFAWERDRYLPIAMSVYNGKTHLANQTSRIDRPADPLAKGTLEQTAILKGGDVFAPSEPVAPGVLSAVPGGFEFEMPDHYDGRRTKFAEWVASRDNTLTARVMVNRIWYYHFGAGIAGNPNNFGATGKKPTHPRLLDWLATELMENGWSVKHLHRVIMSSDAYRRSTNHPDTQSLSEKDPAAILMARFRPRRLAAEEIRDATLATSGELQETMGGIPIRPDMNLEAALQPRMIMGTFAPSYTPNRTPAERNRRSIYALKLRGHRDPFLETFNQPGSEKSCEMRDSSTVSPQALTLLNSDESNDRALALAARVLLEAGSDADAVIGLFRRAYARTPAPDELAAALDHWQTMTAAQEQIAHAPRSYPASVVRRASEENTGEPFSFTEHLFVYEDYVPDLGPDQVDARTRGFADLCLAILNSNEFLYVY